jgi:uncharacterized membrane protein
MLTMAALAAFWSARLLRGWRAARTLATVLASASVLLWLAFALGSMESSCSVGGAQGSTFRGSSLLEEGLVVITSHADGRASRIRC